MAKKMSLLAETSIGHGLLGYCDVIACACISYSTTMQSVRKPGSKLYIRLGACRFAEFALLEELSSESLGQGRPPGPTQVEIVVQVNLTALLNC